MEPLAYLREVEVGMRITTDGPNFFGLDELNQALRGGETVVELREGAVLTTRVGEDAENVHLALTVTPSKWFWQSNGTRGFMLAGKIGGDGGEGSRRNC